MEKVDLVQLCKVLNNKHKVFVLQECVLLCWKAWRMAHIVQKKHKDALKRRAEGRVIHAWHSWKTYVIRAKINPQLNQLAFQHWRLVCLKRMLKQWREASKSTALSTEDERRLSLLAKRHLNLVIYKRSLGQWLQFLKCWARPKRKKLATVQAHINNMTMKGAMAAWRGYVRGKWVKRMKFEQACIQDEHWCRRRTLQRFGSYYPDTFNVGTTLIDSRMDKEPII